MIKISTLNVNGIRAADRKGFIDWISLSRPDIVCLQEIKALENQIPKDIRNLDYYSWFQPAKKKGYSGVGILSRHKPLSVESGMGLEWADSEGRLLIAEYETFSLLSVYIPSGTTGEIRQELKYEFLDYFMKFAKNFLERSKPVIITGDFNIAHTEIDIHNPVANKNSSGFLPEERDWLTKFLDIGFIDAFRSVHEEEKDLYSWWSYRSASKSRNKGWRLDYHMISQNIKNEVTKAEIEKNWDISDHAPVTISYSLSF